MSDRLPELEPPEPSSRRPLKSRGNPVVRKLASWLAGTRVTPNQISQASMGFAALGLLCFWAVAYTGTLGQSILICLAALMVQMRLLCNLLDGMVAVEGGKASRTGAFWNEAPDRMADTLFFWGAGLAAGFPALGLAVAVLAIATAYLRELGRAEGFIGDFSGPMAKQHRMAALTITCLVAALLPTGQSAQMILLAGLWVILAGTAATVIRRALHLLKSLEKRADPEE